MDDLLADGYKLPLLLDTMRLAEITGFAEQTIRHWANNVRPAPSGWPMPVKIGRNVRYRTADLIAWINAGCRPLAAKAESVIEVQLSPKRGRGRPKKDASFL